MFGNREKICNVILRQPVRLYSTAFWQNMHMHQQDWYELLQSGLEFKMCNYFYWVMKGDAVEAVHFVIHCSSTQVTAMYKHSSVCLKWVSAFRVTMQDVLVVMQIRLWLRCLCMRFCYNQCATASIIIWIYRFAMHRVSCQELTDKLGSSTSSTCGCWQLLIHTHTVSLHRRRSQCHLYAVGSHIPSSAHVPFKYFSVGFLSYSELGLI